MKGVREEDCKTSIYKSIFVEWKEITKEMKFIQKKLIFQLLKLNCHPALLSDWNKALNFNDHIIKVVKLLTLGFY